MLSITPDKFLFIKSSWLTELLTPLSLIVQMHLEVWVKWITLAGIQPALLPNSKTDWVGKIVYWNLQFKNNSKYVCVWY